MKKINKQVMCINDLYDLVVEDKSQIFGEVKDEYYQKVIDIYNCFECEK